MGIVDIHTHVFPDKIAERASEGIASFYDIPVLYDGTLSTLLEQGGRAGVTHYVLHAVATNPNQAGRINDFLAQAVAGRPDRLTGFAGIHPAMESPIAEMERARRLGLRGIKLHPDIQQFFVDDARMFPLYEAMGSDMILLTHAGDHRYDYSSPARLRRVRDLFPRLTMICAHLGGWSVWEDAREMLCGQNVYVDSSSALFWLGPKRALELIRSYGADRVLFGTDYPVWDAQGELERLDALGLTEDERSAILYANAAKLLGLDI
ncbi:MAG TPA: amidohydrolase family protein [Clostridia bacterium]|nr:amidohydrolase family protein [Clostridia bacterium]